MADEVDTLREIAFEAGEILKRGYVTKKRVEYKGVVDLVTQYDRECEKFILERVEKEFRGFTPIAEESYRDGRFIDRDEDRVVYIDPIDGTTNFVHQIPHFAISIGLYIEGVAQFGVVYNPILEEMFWAVNGEGAYKNSLKIEVSKQKNLQNSLIATGFPYAKVERGEEYKWSVRNVANILPEVQDLRRLGSASLDICYIAEGKFEGFYEIGLEPWDVAGAILILQEAGGEISRVNGESYRLGDFDILASNGHIHKKLSNLLEGW